MTTINLPDGFNNAHLFQHPVDFPYQLDWDMQNRTVDILGQPSQTEIELLQTALQNHERRVTERKNVLNNIKQTAETTVGVPITQLDNNQIKSLLAVLLWKNGAIANDATIKPLSDWID